MESGFAMTSSLHVRVGRKRLAILVFCALSISFVRELQLTLDNAARHSRSSSLSSCFVVAFLQVDEF